MTWVGYKVPLTETCDEYSPHLITHVGTSVATEQDIDHTSRFWVTNKTSHGEPAIFVRFSPTDCTPCPERTRCTRNQSGGREFTLVPQDAYIALRNARQRQQTSAFPQQYTRRAGIEGTLSQAVCILGLRQPRYIGLAKTRLQIFWSLLL